MTKSIKYACGFALGLLIAFPLNTLAQDHSDAFIKAQAVFEQGLRGSENDNKNAGEQFKHLTELEPGNPLFMAYYGSTYALKADHAWMPWTRLKLGEQGLELIDKALKLLSAEHDQILVRSVPMSIETRLVAINTFLKMPQMFFHGRYDAGKNLLAEIMKGPLFAASPPIIQARYHFQAAFVAQAEKKRADEVNHLKRLLELDPESLDAPAARTRLKELGA